MSILHLKYDYSARSESSSACYSHCYVTWYPLTTGIVASQCPSARDAVLVTRYLTPFISACLNSFLRFFTAIKHIYKESANIIEGCNVACDTNDCWNFQYAVPVITIESMVKRARPSYTRDFLTPGICSLIKPAAMVKLM